MRYSDLFGLARDNLSRARLRTALTATGVAIGTAAVVTLLAFGNGIEAIAVQQANGFGQLTQIRVDPYTSGRNAQPHALTTAMLGRISALPHVAGIATQLVAPPVRLSIGGMSRDAGTLAQSPMTTSVTLLAGSITGRAQTDGVLVPASLVHLFAPSRAALIGRPVTLTAGGSVAGGGGIVVLGADRHVTAYVAGVYDDGGAASPGPRDRGRPAQIVIPTALGATLDGALRGTSGTAYLAGQGYSGLYVQTDDARQTAGVATAIGALSYQTQDRANFLDRLHLFFNILKGGLGAIGGVALVVAAVGIANTMIMTVLERTREIGIMKALGAEPGAIRTLFLTETALVGVLGGVIGLALSGLVGLAGNAIFARWLVSQDPTASTGALFVVPPSLVAFALLLAVAISLIGGALPSRRAVRLEPLDALRYE